MNIIVCVKDTVDVAEIKTDAETKSLILQGIPRKISDFDKNALEAAIVIKEKLDSKITTITVGQSEAQERIREALAMGADEGIILNDPIFENLDSHGISVALASAIKKIGEYDLILCGEASIDAFAGQIGPRLAELLGIPQITYARSISVEGDKITVERDVGDKVIEIESGYPALVTVVKELNEPRLPTLMQILGASSKKLEEWNADTIAVKNEDLGLDVGGIVKTESVSAITMERKNVIIEGEIPEAVENLAKELEKSGVIGR